MAERGAWYSVNIVFQDGQRSRIILKHEVGSSHRDPGPWRVEWIKPHVRLEHFNRPLRIARKHESQPEAPVHVVWVERYGSFDLFHGGVVLAHPREDKTEHRMCFGSSSTDRRANWCARSSAAGFR